MRTCIKTKAYFYPVLKRTKLKLTAIIKKITYKDYIRAICGILIIVKSMLLILHKAYFIFKNTSESNLFIKFCVNYLFSLLFLLFGLLLLFGVKSKISLMISFVLTFSCLSLCIICNNFIGNDMALSALIMFMTLYLYVMGAGNMSVERLLNE